MKIETKAKKKLSKFESLVRLSRRSLATLRVEFDLCADDDGFVFATNQEITFCDLPYVKILGDVT